MAGLGGDVVLGTTRPSPSGRPGSFLEVNVMLPVTAVALLESIMPAGRGERTTSAPAVESLEGLTATDRGPRSLLRAGPDAGDLARPW